MKNRSVSYNKKSKSRSLVRTPSLGLVDYIEKRYQKSIPVPVITTAHKLYGKHKQRLQKDDRFVKRFTNDKGDIDAPKFIEYLNKNQRLQKGRPLTAQSIGRVYQNYSNYDNKLSFEYIMKIGERSGVTITQKMAKAMVRKYGKNKDHLNLQDCLQLNSKWTAKQIAKLPKNKRK